MVERATQTYSSFGKMKEQPDRCSSRLKCTSEMDGCGCRSLHVITMQFCSVAFFSVLQPALLGILCIAFSPSVLTTHTHSSIVSIQFTGRYVELTSIILVCHSACSSEEQTKMLSGLAIGENAATELLLAEAFARCRKTK